ncbi:AraC family transcriptional regulator [Flagellimonas sp. HMM57]|uniref:helix-turn-helix domain-containing protein n=1 Tax=unclassified Flagellimonas TaxID=2644544 RepID=UPI0013D3007F|nr:MULTISPECIES: AraC family transcriptional regulator [unclassified Flagellimonas]UII76179.1 AraC family transcriptional regulator [Flagellimonas sp. HMM57]
MILILIRGNFFIKKKEKNPLSKNTNVTKPLSKTKYKNSGLTTDLANDFKVKLVELMKKNKLYQNPNLRLNDVALKLGISVHQTSQIINQRFGQDFNTFVNTYRVAEAIRLFRINENPSIGEVLFEVGFNNKATFNKAFKNYVNMTPTEFIEASNNKNKVHLFPSN